MDPLGFPGSVASLSVLPRRGIPWPDGAAGTEHAVARRPQGTRSIARSREPGQGHLLRGGFALAPRCRRPLWVRASVAIEKETPESEPPPTSMPVRRAGSRPVWARFEAIIRQVEGEVCEVLDEADDDGVRFVEDIGSSPGGGGGISRVLQHGRVFEKARVNVSIVYGVMLLDAYRAAIGKAGKNEPPQAWPRAILHRGD